MTAALATHGLTKHFGDFEALVDLDLEVRPGEVFGFLGPNGAGKSTMIRTVLDELRPTAGRAEIGGLDTHRDSLAIRRRLGYLPSDLALDPQLTGHQTIDYFGRLRGGIDQAHVGELADRLEARLDRRVGQLSTGNRQKVGIILAFMHRPDLVVMDEPATGLDPLVQHEFQLLMRETAQQGRSVFLSSHTLSEVQRAADRVGIIRSGRLVAVEEVAALRSRAVRRIQVEIDGVPDRDAFAAIPGVRDLSIDGHRVELAFDGEMERLLAVVTDHHRLLDISTAEPDLEDIFLGYYADGAPHDGVRPEGDRR